jgi:ribonuclease HII
LSLLSPAERNQKLLKYDLELQNSVEGSVAGVDEAGRGPLAGPVLTSAVIVKNPNFTVRIDDSKKLSPKMRELAFEEIQKNCIVAVSMRSHEQIDAINIYRATIESMEESVKLLAEKPALVMVDGPINLKVGIQVRGIISGDSKSLAIACASIIAKVTRDRLMMVYHQRYPQYGFDTHKGYGTAKHMSALEEFGPTPIHRKSFQPVAKLITKEN